MVIPSYIEEYLGEVSDPKENMGQINSANKVINEFVNAMDANEVPEPTIQDIITATDVIGLYVGYPKEAADLPEYASGTWQTPQPASVSNAADVGVRITT